MEGLTISAPRRIRFVITRGDHIGGAQVHVTALAGRLAGLGWDVGVITGRAGRPFLDALEAEGIEVTVLPSLNRSIRPLADARSLVDITSHLRSSQPDLVSLHSTKAGFLGRVAAARLGLKVIFTAHGWSFTEGPPPARRVVGRTLEKVTAQLLDGIICVSERDMELARSAGLKPRGPMATIPNGVPDVPLELRASPDQDECRLVMVARFTEQKDHTSLLGALAPLSRKRWTLDLVGSGPRLEAVCRRARELGLESRVRFLGYSDRVSEILSNSDLFVLSTRWEGLPRSILEALRAGLPVVASAVGGIPELVQGGANGYLVPAGDQRALRSRLVELIGNPGLRRRMGQAGRSLYERRFTLDRMVRDTLAFYDSVLDSRTSP